MSKAPLCPTCKEPAIARYGIMETLVGYSSFTDDDGNVHEHDDNCLKQNFACSNDHVWTLSKRRRCKTDGCNWLGKEECFCHERKKVDSFCDDGVPLILNHDRMCQGEWRVSKGG
ncbi:hypothetical protein LCGC14_1417260 [marine sediment metagenome]|uniref:Uncharacterized protein n=1 Tax=marine sediment metagenome TaxID=412755 RepID=A0A0F9JSW5_9ZZZZ